MMDRIKKGGRQLGTFLLALVLGVGVFSLSRFLSLQVHSSTFLAQSRIFRVLLEEDSVELLSLVTDKDKRKMTEKFIVALTNAYVNFELIPINEGETFTVVMGCLTQGLQIDDFAYSGRDLIIKGRGPQEETVWGFKDKLERKDYFQRVDITAMGVTSEGVAFSVSCIAKETRYPELFAP